MTAVDYYEACEPGLGADFALEVHAAISNILNFPLAWPILEDDMRRCQVRRFPFGIIYSVDEPAIFILAVMHLHRSPGYWQDRKS
jgi:hypothetical protein